MSILEDGGQNQAEVMAAEEIPGKDMSLEGKKGIP